MTNVVFWPYFARCEERIDLFEKAFPRETNNWCHRFTDFKNYDEGAVVIMNGGGCYEQDLQGMHEMQEDLKPFRWVLLISMNDEGSGQHLEWIEHPRVKIWVQDPKPNKHNFCHRFPSWPIKGYEKVLTSFPKQDRMLDWFFSGSMRDLAWDEQIRNLPGNGKFYDTHLGYEGYMQHLYSSKFCPCRPCFQSPETCRVYDALEAGCIPIVGIYPAINPTNGVPWWPTFGFDWPNYWEYIYGETPPFPIIKDASDLNWTFKELMNNWTPEQSQKVYDWWQTQKQKFISDLREDVRRLSDTSLS